MNLLVTGGLGYVGSHFLVVALQAGHQVTVIDNLENSSVQVIEAISAITEKEVKFVKGDIRNSSTIEEILAASRFDTVVHFAGYKAVGESSDKPLKYYENNVVSSLNLLKAMKRYEVNSLIFSSSATVYGMPEFNPYTEQHRKLPFNPYGQTKSMVEDILHDLCNSDDRFSGIALRYFNPIGAHPSGLIGEDPKGIPNNLMPYITKVAVGELSKLGVFGNDYDTPDGTGVRDYIHVMDLAYGHLKAVEFQVENRGYNAFNLGAGKGYSVLDVVKAFEQENGVTIPLVFKARRAGDLPAYWADASLAFEKLNWKTELTLENMVRDSWNWQKKNPNGFVG